MKKDSLNKKILAVMLSAVFALSTVQFPIGGSVKADDTPTNGTETGEGSGDGGTDTGSDNGTTPQDTGDGSNDTNDSGESSTSSEYKVYIYNASSGESNKSEINLSASSETDIQLSGGVL